MKTLRAQGSVAAGVLSIAVLLLAGAVRASADGSYPQGSSSAGQTCIVHKVDINRASANELARIPGIRDEEAFRIVQFREVFGPYHDLSELLRVRNVYPSDLAILQDHLYIKGSGSDQMASMTGTGAMRCKRS